MLGYMRVFPLTYKLRLRLLGQSCVKHRPSTLTSSVGGLSFITLRPTIGLFMGHCPVPLRSTCPTADCHEFWLTQWALPDDKAPMHVCFLHWQILLQNDYHWTAAWWCFPLLLKAQDSWGIRFSVFFFHKRRKQNQLVTGNQRKCIQSSTVRRIVAISQATTYTWLLQDL